MLDKSHSTKQNTLLSVNYDNILRSFFYILQSKIPTSFIYKGTRQPQFTFGTPGEPGSECVKIYHYQRKDTPKVHVLVMVYQEWYIINYNQVFTRCKCCINTAGNRALSKYGAWTTVKFNQECYTSKVTNHLCLRVKFRKVTFT